MDIQGKVAIITGASAGIGLAAARLFAQRGARVALGTIQKMRMVSFLRVEAPQK